MEYLDNKHQKIKNADKVLLDPNQIADKEAAQHRAEAVHKMESFKFYVKAPSSAPKKVEEIKPIQKRKFALNMVTLTERMLFMDNLSTMLRAGLALSPALRTIRKEIKNKYFADILEYLEKHVENGQLLSLGMKHYPKVFPDMIVATVEVGENTGMLADSFGHLADILKREKELRSKVIGAVMYPAIVMIALVAISIFLGLVIFPQLVDLFEGAGVKLPFVLVAVKVGSEFIKNYTWYTLGGLVVLVVLLRMTFNQPKPKLFLHTAILKMPFVGTLIKELSLTRFAGNLHALLAAGLSIVKSMEITAKTLGNLKYRQEIVAMSKELEKGISMEKAMSQRPDLFPSLTVQLCQIGETTGELENILSKIAKFYDDRVNNVLNNLSTILEPVLLVIVGVAVGFIALSVIGPMYELTSSFAE